MKIFNGLGIIGVILCLGLTIFGASRAAALTIPVDRAITETEAHVNHVLLRFGYSIENARLITITYQEVREGYTKVTAYYTFTTKIGEHTKTFTGSGHYLFEEEEVQGKDKSPCGGHFGNYSPKQGSQLVQKIDIKLALSGDGSINSTYSSESYLADNERYESIVATQTGNVPKNYEVDK